MKTVRKIWDRLTKRTKTVHVISNNDYLGEISRWQREVPASVTAEEICCEIFGEGWDLDGCTEVSENYVYSSTKYWCGPRGPHLITEIWWGEGAEEKANGKYAELLAGGVKPTPQGW